MPEPTMDPRLDVLLSRAADESATAEEWGELEALLAADPSARRRYVQMMDLHAELRARHAKALSPDAPQNLPKPRGSVAWFSWRPLTAAAAGLVIGLCCASVVFAYVAPSLGTSDKAVTLLDDGFESGPAPLVTGVPTEPGRWSGDYTDVVGEQQGVTPVSGGKMLRFLRADYEGKPNAIASRVVDAYRLIDVRPYRQEFANGSMVAQLSAGFNAFEYPRSETYIGTITIHALDGESMTNGSLRAISARDDTSLAVASTGGVQLDRNPESWQRLTSDLRVPANTDFLLIHILIPAGQRTREKAGFGGHYVDEVRLTLRRSPLP